MKLFGPILAGTALFLGCLSASAADYQWLSFRLSDNSEVKVAAKDLEMNYIDGDLVLKSATVDERLAVSNILSMQFADLVSVVETFDSDSLKGGDFYSLSGVYSGNFNSLDEARENLAPGTYVVKGESSTFKVIF